MEAKTGLQLYSVREDCARDLPGTLSKISEMGYDGVEFAGYYDYGAEELGRILEERGLLCCGSHIEIDDLRGDKFERTVEFNLALANEFLIVKGLPGEMRSSLRGAGQPTRSQVPCTFSGQFHGRQR